MSATLIDGKAIAASLRGALAARVASHIAEGKRAPALAVVLVGEDPASEVYVASKAKHCVEIGMRSLEYKLDAATPQAALLALVARLNADDAVDGILVQLPLPQHIDTGLVIEAIDPEKDVDGFHPINVGRLASGAGGVIPCTPRGSMALIRSVRADLSGLNAVVLGRSTIVGRPMAQLLLAADCTVTIAHSKTRDLAAMCRTADILIAAIGKPRFVDASFVKPGAIIIDVGINRIAAGDKTRLVGDCDEEAILPIASAITPVPGGVGPMTIACLLENTLESYERRSIAIPAKVGTGFASGIASKQRE